MRGHVLFSLLLQSKQRINASSLYPSPSLSKFYFPEITAEHASVADHDCTKSSTVKLILGDRQGSLNVTRANCPVLLIALFCPSLKLKTAAKALNLYTTWKDYARLIHTRLVILANAGAGLFKKEKKAEINSTELKSLG